MDSVMWGGEARVCFRLPFGNRRRHFCSRGKKVKCNWTGIFQVKFLLLYFVLLSLGRGGGTRFCIGLVIQGLRRLELVVSRTLNEIIHISRKCHWNSAYERNSASRFSQLLELLGSFTRLDTISKPGYQNLCTYYSIFCNSLYSYINISDS
ncbi:hypothetical protein PUMCH_003403 [Australozyma saopauloensis]|uniref:Uncharacterized protein n=1 Tax=Australozyma saopauloensis TaxID=291208 RepID=A0AAX4HBZ9_9ASCO|nr:hypothetical protein PUMCH_003403 [[Candida] saopauloensis]